MLNSNNHKAFLLEKHCGLYGKNSFSFSTGRGYLGEGEGFPGPVFFLLLPFAQRWLILYFSIVLTF